MTTSAIFAQKFSLPFKKYLSYGSVIILSSFIFLSPCIYLWAYLQQHFGGLHGLTWVLKPIVIFIFSFFMFIFFGGTVPFLLQETKQNSKAIGKALAISSFGNVAGYLIMTFVLYERTPDSLIPYIIIMLIYVACLLIGEINRMEYYLAFTLLVLSTAVFILWPSKLISVGYQNLHTLQEIKKIQETLVTWDDYKKYNNLVSILHFKDGEKWLSINGYISLRFKDNKLAQLREMIVGLSPAVYSKQHDNTLVLGLGSGVTAGTVAKLYKKTKIVEINPAMIEGIESFSKDNMDILHDPKVTIVIQDGIIELLNTQEKYDTIVNTVTSPKYFSSSKLWTKEVFDTISKKLNKGGIYSMWMDITIGEEGMKIMQKTAESSFRECRYIYLNAGYLNIICSNQKITPENQPDTYWPEAIQDILRQYNLKAPISTFITDLTYFSDDNRLYNNSTKINTLDLPILEFTSDDLYVYLKNNFIINLTKDTITKSPFDGHKLSKEELTQRCSSYKIISPLSAEEFCNK